MLASMLWGRGSMRKLTVCAAHAVAWRNPMLCAHDNGFMVVDGYMVGAFEVYRHCWRQGCACVCTAPDACAHVVAPGCVAAWVAVRSGVVSVARRVFMQWAYSFSGSEGGLGSDSSRRSVKGLSVLHSVVAQQAFKGGGGSAPLAASVVFIWWYPCSGGTASAASRAALAASLRRMLLNVFGGLPTTAQPVFIWAVGCSRAARCGFVCRSPRRRSSGGSAVQFQWRRGRPRKLLLAALGYIRCSKVAACPRAACHPPHGRWCPYKLYKVQRQRQRAGRPRRPLLAAWSRVSACCTWRGSQCSKAAAFRRRSAAWWSHSEGTASAAGRVALAASPRCARPRGSAGCIGGSRCSRAEVRSVQHARCALCGGCASGDTSSAAARAASAASPRCDRPKESTGGTRWRSRCSRAAGARMQRVARRMLDGGRGVGVLHQQQGGRPRAQHHSRRALQGVQPPRRIPPQRSIGYTGL